MKCLGRNMDQHCCWLNGKLCKYLEENTEPGQRWSCALHRELGDWDAVIADPRYIEDIHPEYVARAERLNRPVTNCKEYPTGVDKCAYCGSNT